MTLDTDNKQGAKQGAAPHDSATPMWWFPEHATRLDPPTCDPNALGAALGDLHQSLIEKSLTGDEATAVIVSAIAAGGAPFLDAVALARTPKVVAEVRGTQVVVCDPFMRFHCESEAAAHMLARMIDRGAAR